MFCSFFLFCAVCGELWTQTAVTRGAVTFTTPPLRPAGLWCISHSEFLLLQNHLSKSKFVFSFQVNVAFSIVYESGLNEYALYMDCEGHRAYHKGYVRTMSHLFRNYRKKLHTYKVIWAPVACSFPALQIPLGVTWLHDDLFKCSCPTAGLPPSLWVQFLPASTARPWRSGWTGATWGKLYTFRTRCRHGTSAGTSNQKHAQILLIIKLLILRNIKSPKEVIFLN